MWILIGASITWSSCGITDHEMPIPFYLELGEPVTFEPRTEIQGTNKITEAWVFVDNQILGVYPLPGKVPIQWEDKEMDIKILAGIRNSGMNDYPVFYPFFKDIGFQLKPEPNGIYPVDMKFRYIDDCKLSVYENFESSNIFEFDLDNKPETSMVLTDEEACTGRQCGMVVLNSGNRFVEVGALTQVLKGQNARGKSYVEFDYKGDGEIAVGIAKSQNGVIIIKYILFVPAKKEWNHIYADFTDIISPNDFESYRMILAFSKTGINQESKVYIDNYKHIHF
ncbi:MAG: hypothetical protein UZ09_BCD002000659 [Bacteroidetes bacterium OLB9]|nr:MAG: hypothetical protein UZ09_BCD002000659 [Bacteroidetes bacterium OLB9]